MPRSKNSQVAVDLYKALADKHGWEAARAWHGIARLLLTTKVWNSGWQSFHGVVVYRETNDFKRRSVLCRAETLTQYLAEQFQVERKDIGSHIGLYWDLPDISSLQPNNLLGHAFRSLVVAVLQRFGDPDVTYEEEVEPHNLFPGYAFSTRSRAAKLDILALRRGLPVALISTRWRFRHDRVDVVEEALEYAPAARRQNRNCRLYAVTAEFSPARLTKVLDHCPPAMLNGALSAAVHLAPELIWNGLRENGRSKCLQSLEWLIRQTYEWK